MKQAVKLDPPAALRALARRLGGREAVEFPLDEAPDGWLAEPVLAAKAAATVAGRRPVRVAAADGFAVSAAAAAGGEFAVLGTLAAEAVLDPDGLPPGPAGNPSPGRAPSPPPALAGVWRVEPGARLPEGTDRVVPAAWTAIVGPRRIRIEQLPAAGAGAHAPGAPGGGEPAAARGARLDARLRSFLAARGAGAVRAVPPFDVAFATVGDEIIDPRSSLAPGHRHDVTAPWIEEALARLGLRPVPLGILADSPAAVRDAILHARNRRIEVLILAGGLGEGVTDRTFESLVRFGVEVALHGVDLDGASRLLHARADGLDILGLGGMPIETAAGFDIFLGPALLARLGAPRARWDWSIERWPIDPAVPQPAGPRPEAGWVARPAALVPAAPGERRVSTREVLSPFLPVAPGQEGWEVRPSPRDAGTGENGPGGGAPWAHFAPRMA